MVDPITAQRLAYWGLFLLISVLILFVRILPLDVAAGGLPGPDWALIIGFVWVLKRPDYVPVWLFAVVLLASDMIYMRPPGLWAGLAVVGLEFLRARVAISRELPFLFEWATVSAVLLAMIIANRLILGIFVIPQPGFGQDMILFLLSAAVYPLVVLGSATLLGVRKLAPGAVDRRGHRI